jgi:hypothetical protein
MIAHSLGTLPVGLVGGEPTREFTEEEVGVLERGGLTLEPYAGIHDAGLSDRSEVCGDVVAGSDEVRGKGDARRRG